MYLAPDAHVSNVGQSAHTPRLTLPFIADTTSFPCNLLVRFSKTMCGRGFPDFAFISSKPLTLCCTPPAVMLCRLGDPVRLFFVTTTWRVGGILGDSSWYSVIGSYESSLRADGPERWPLGGKPGSNLDNFACIRLVLSPSCGKECRA